MAKKSKPQTQDDASARPADVAEHLQDAGFGNVLGMGTAWMSTFREMNTEMMRFVTERIKEDVKTQQAILNCKSPTELLHIQAQFMQNAMNQYHDETGKLMGMARKVPKADADD